MLKHKMIIGNWYYMVERLLWLESNHVHGFVCSHKRSCHQPYTAYSFNLYEQRYKMDYFEKPATINFKVKLHHSHYVGRYLNTLDWLSNDESRSWRISYTEHNVTTRPNSIYTLHWFLTKLANQDQYSDEECDADWLKNSMCIT